MRELAVPLRTRLLVWLPVLLIGLGAAVAGLARHAGASWLFLAVGVVAAAVAMVSLVRPPALVLDDAGFAVRTALGVTSRRAWADCGPFRVWQGNVVWSRIGAAATDDQTAAARTSRGWRARAAADDGLPAQYGMSADKLADLLNEHRSRAAGL